jgi:hypothetical protein
MVSKKLFELAQSDLDSILKYAAASFIEPKTAIQWKYFKESLGPVLKTIAAMGIAGAASYHFAKKDKENHQTDLMNSMKLVAMKSPSFAEHPGTFIDRFGELTAISPTIAKNPNLAAKLLEKKLHTGFDVDDIHKLTAIEHNTSTSRGGISPSNAARAAAGTTLGTLVRTFGAEELAAHRQRQKDMKSEFDELNKQSEESVPQDLETMMKNAQAEYTKQASGSPKPREVSESCLGKMLSDRYLMFKTAGFWDRAGASAKNMGKGLELIAPALAIGGGLELVRRVFETRRNNALEQQADKNFKMLTSTSDVIKGDMNVAREAFEALKAVAPSLAARPLVAKTFIENTVAAGQMPPQTVQQLAEAENQIRGLGGGHSDFMSNLKSTISILPKHKDLQGTGFEPVSHRPRKPKI